MNTTKKALVLLADGFEEVEAVTPIDYLRRAGIEVTVAATGGDVFVTGSHGLTVKAGALAGEVPAAGWDAVICPGGLPGSTNLAASPETAHALTAAAKAGKLVCAICAAPAVVLSPLGLLEGKTFTGYPGTETGVTGARYSQEKVVRDGGLITSRGAGTAGLFACAIISALLGEGEGEKIAAKTLLS